MDESKTEKLLKMTSPCLTTRVEYDSHATFKAGLTSDREVSYMADQFLNSQATSKAGLFMGSDQDLTDFGERSGLKKIPYIHHLVIALLTTRKLLLILTVSRAMSYHTIPDQQITEL